jgi:hypothetical protein
MIWWLLVAGLLLVAPQTAIGAEPVCAQSTTIFCEDWETGTLPGQWTDDIAPGLHALTTTPANVFSGARALETTWTEQAGAGALARWFNANGQPNAPLTGYDRVFARWYVKLESGLTCNQNCPKFTVLYGNRTDTPFSGFGQAGICPNGTDFFYAGIAENQPPGRGLIFYDYDPNMACTQPVGNNFGQEIEMSPPQTIPLNTWTCIETEVQLNTPGSSNGAHRVWVNDVLAGARTGLRWRDSTILNLNAFQLSFSGGVVGTKHLWYDNIVVAQQRVFCNIAALTGPPAPPTDVVTGPAFFATVTKAGTGTGTVTGPGINCGTDCTHPYTVGDNVTLTATPAGGSTFTGWSGACTGTGNCTVTMSQARAMTATFGGTAAYALLVSTAPSRSPTAELNGYVAAPLANLYVFTRPVTGVTQVRFFLDDPAMTAAPIHIEGTAEYDFVGTAGDGTALPFDTSTINTGTHTITAAVDLSAGGVQVVSASFTTTTTPAGPVTLSWTDTNTAPNETNTEIYWCQGPGCTPVVSPQTLAGSVGSNVTTFTHTAAPGGTVGYALRAINPPSLLSPVRYVP